MATSLRWKSISSMPAFRISRSSFFSTLVPTGARKSSKYTFAFSMGVAPHFHVSAARRSRQQG